MGNLAIAGEPVAASALLDAARRLPGEEQWHLFLERRSAAQQAGRIEIEPEEGGLQDILKKLE